MNETEVNSDISGSVCDNTVDGLSHYGVLQVTGISFSLLSCFKV